MATALQAYSPRITGLELPRSGKPLLIVNYRVAGTSDNPQIDLKGVSNPLRETDWMTKTGIISPGMQQLLNAEPNTQVYTDSNPEYAEGLRALWWVFGYRVRPFLGSSVEPRGRGPDGGSLLGSVVESDGYLKIQGIDYFVQPEVTRCGETLWQTQLYAQVNSKINSDATAMNAAYRFVRPEWPDPEWVRNEVERMEKKEGLNEKQVTDLYRQLRQHMLVDFIVRSREILAWPFADQFVDLSRVPRELFDRLVEQIPELSQYLKKQ